MVRKKILTIMLVFLVISSFATGVNGEELKPYKVGVLLEVTGGLSYLGEPAKNSIEMVAEEINATGGINGHPLELIIYDTMGQPTNAVTLTQRLIKRDKVAAIIGPLSSGSVLAMTPIIEKAEVLNIALGLSRRIVEPPKKWVFSTVHTDINAVSCFYTYMKKNGITKVGIITATDSFGDSGREQLLKLAPEYGIEVVADQKFSGEDSDMTAQLTNIQRTDAEVVICWTVGPTAAIVTKNWKQLAMDIPLCQSPGAASKEFLKMAGRDAEGVIFPTPKVIVVDQIPDSDPQKEILMKYKNAYVERYRSEISKFGGNAYDAIKIVVEALEAVGDNSTEMRDYIENSIDYLGVIGRHNFSPQAHCGLTPDYVVVVQVVNGEWKILN